MSFAICKSYGAEDFSLVARQLFPTEWEIDLVKRGSKQPRISITNFSNVLHIQQFAVALECLRKCAVASVKGEQATLAFRSEDPGCARTPSEVAKWLVCLSEQHELIDPLIKKAKTFINGLRKWPNEEALDSISPLIICEEFAPDIIKGYGENCRDTSTDAFFLKFAQTIRQIPKPLGVELDAIIRLTGLCKTESRMRLQVFAAILDHHVDFGVPCKCVPLILASLDRCPELLPRDDRYWLDHCRAAIAFLERDPPSWYEQVRELEICVLLKCFYEAEAEALAATSWQVLHRARELFLHMEGYINQTFIDWLEIALITRFQHELPSDIDDSHQVVMERSSIQT